MTTVALENKKLQLGTTELRAELLFSILKGKQSRLNTDVSSEFSEFAIHIIFFLIIMISQQKLHVEGSYMEQGILSLYAIAIPD